MQDVKKSAHARMDTMAKDFDVIERNCQNSLTQYVNKADMRELREDMHGQFSGLTTRIDSLLLAFKNGHTG